MNRDEKREHRSPNNSNQAGVLTHVLAIRGDSATRRDTSRSRPDGGPGFSTTIVFAVIGLALAPGLFVAFPVPLRAQTDRAGSASVSCRNSVTSLSASTPTKKAVEQSEDEIHIYRVAKTDGPSLWLEAEAGGSSGWALADQVVPVELAIAFFTSQMRDHPKDSFPILMRATVWHDKKDVGRAMEDYTEAIRLDPQNAALYCNRGYLRGEQNEFDKAIADFTEAIRLDPRDPIAYLHRGHAWSEQHQYDKAVADFTETIRLNPQNAYAFRSRGHAWLDKGDQNAAVVDFTEAIRLDPRDVTAYISRGLSGNRSKRPTRPWPTSTRPSGSSSISRCLPRSWRRPGAKERIRQSPRGLRPCHPALPQRRPRAQCPRVGSRHLF